MGGSSGGGGGGTSVIRYAPYIEDHHKAFLKNISNDVKTLKGESPFSTYTGIDPNIGFLGAGITIGSYASLFNNFSSYMQDVNILTLYDTVFTKVIAGQEVKDAIAAEGRLLSDDVTLNAYPRLMVGARDINAVMSSTFIIAKGNIENQRLKMLSKFSADLKYNLLSHVNSIWKTNLDWNIQVVNTHRQNLITYYDMVKTADEFNYTMYVKDILWPFTLYDYQRAALGALQGATNTKTTAGESGTGVKVLGGVLSGAAAGGMMMGPMGALGGAVLGGLGSLF